MLIYSIQFTFSEIYIITQWAYLSLSFHHLIYKSVILPHNVFHNTSLITGQRNIWYNFRLFFFNFENVKIKLFVFLETYQQMWCVDLFNSVYVQWNLYYNCKFTKFDTKLNVQIPVKNVHRNRNRNSGRSMLLCSLSNLVLLDQMR